MRLPYTTSCRPSPSRSATAGIGPIGRQGRLRTAARAARAVLAVDAPWRPLTISGRPSRVEIGDGGGRGRGRRRRCPPVYLSSQILVEDIQQTDAEPPDADHVGQSHQRRRPPRPGQDSLLMAVADHVRAAAPRCSRHPRMAMRLPALAKMIDGTPSPSRSIAMTCPETSTARPATLHLRAEKSPTTALVRHSLAEGFAGGFEVRQCRRPSRQTVSLWQSSLLPQHRLDADGPRCTTGHPDRARGRRYRRPDTRRGRRASRTRGPTRADTCRRPDCRPRRRRTASASNGRRRRRSRRARPRGSASRPACRSHRRPRRRPAGADRRSGRPRRRRRPGSRHTRRTWHPGARTARLVRRRPRRRCRRRRADTAGPGTASIVGGSCDHSRCSVPAPLPRTRRRASRAPHTAPPRWPAKLISGIDASRLD
jgi:hypothetical protein